MDYSDDPVNEIHTYFAHLNETMFNFEYKQKFRHIPERIMNQGEIEFADREIAADYIEHIPMPPQFKPNREGFKGFVGMLRTAFPDLHYEVDHLTSTDLIGENQKVAHRIVAHGTHSGPWGPIPPTGKPMTWSEIHIGLFVEGRLVEHWGNIDTLGIMQQMGAIPGWVDQPEAPQPPKLSGKMVTSTSENILMTRRYLQEVWNKDRLEVAAKLIHPGSVNSSRPMLPTGPEGAKKSVEFYRQAFPDMHLFIQDVIAEQDIVLTRLAMNGTHQGAFMGLPATGRDVEMEACTIFRFGDGQIVQRWVEADIFTLLGQIGMGG
jgi:predicted ester cyclase